MDPRWSVKFASDSSLMIDHEDGLSRAIFRRIQNLRGAKPFVKNLHPAYRSLLIDFDPVGIAPRSFEALVVDALRGLDGTQEPQGRIVEVPVVYGGEEGPDLIEVAQRSGLSTEEVIRLHSEPVYDVAFLGFSPGFPYLTGLPSTLYSPRKPTPRLRVPAGSVAIGGEQTGIYPEEGPGGWQIIGRTRLKLFDPSQDPPTLLFPGDRLRFRPTSPGAEEGKKR